MTGTGAADGLADRPIRKFNPGTFQSDAEVIEQFVVRKRELDIVLDVLDGNIDSPSCQHVLVVAPRGRGKTMLLARTAAALRSDDARFGRLLPVRFMEESQEIFNAADFWLETLFHLAREVAAHDPEIARELRETHADLNNRWREQELAGHARAAVLQTADRLGKKLVLMVENLQSLCENVDDDFGWKLREALQSEPQLMLLASATSRFEGLDDAGQPFFELFRTVDLKPLDTEECRCLWQVVSGDTMKGREIRPLQILTGGSPRLLVIVAEFARRRSLRRLMEELVTLIDEHTEYFRSHLEILPKSECRVYVAVIDLWQPSSTGEIAARARMDVRVVSTMLGRLVNRGAVIPEGSGKKRLYAAAERLYSIYYKMRRERDEAAVVQNLIHFMVMFYSADELLDMSDQLRLDAVESPVIREGIKRAIAELPSVGDGFPGAALLGKQILSRTAENYQREVEQQIDAAFQEKAFQRVVEIADRALASHEAGSSQMSELLIAYILHMKAVAYRQLGNSQMAIAAYDEVLSRFGDSDELNLQQLVVAALTGKGRVSEKLRDFQAAIAVYDEVLSRFGDSDEPDIQWWVALALNGKGEASEELGDFQAAIAAYDEVLARLGDSDEPDIQRWVAVALNGKGSVSEERDDFQAAIAAYDEVLARFGDSDEPDIQRWVALALSEKGMRQTEIGLTAEALETYQELERRLDTLTGDEKTRFEWKVMSLRAMALMARKKRRAAMDAFRSAYSAFLPNNEVAMREMLWLVPDLIATGASAHDLVEILSSDSAKSDALAPQIVALRQYGGESVRAPAEVREVAADIRTRIEERSAEVSRRTGKVPMSDDS